MNNTHNPSCKNHAALTEWENAVLYRIASEEQLGEGIDGYRPRNESFYVKGDKKNIDGTLGSLLRKGVIYDAFAGDLDPMWCTCVYSIPIAAEFCKLNSFDIPAE